MRHGTIRGWSCLSQKGPTEFSLDLFLWLSCYVSCYIQLFVTSGTASGQASLTFTVSWSLLKFMAIESVMLSKHLIFCHPPLLLPSVFPSIRVFSGESALRIMWPKYWSFSFSTSPSNEYSELISFIDWFDLLPCCSRDSQEFSISFINFQHTDLAYSLLNLYLFHVLTAM